MSKIIPENITKGKILIIGFNELSEKLINTLNKSQELYPVGIIDDEQENTNKKISEVSVVGTSSELAIIAKKLNVHRAVISNECILQKNNSMLKNLLHARLAGLEIQEPAEMYEELYEKIPVAHIHDRWLVFEQGFVLQSQVMIQRIKRCVDISVSLLALVFLAPLCPLLSLIIYIDSPGPIFFKQKRVGKDEQEFTLIKFRSMHENAEKNGAVWAQEDDPRVTRVGRWLRALRIDELPQLWNVLKGDMSLIGPRPERIEFVRKLEDILPYYYIRHTTRPGITGWAQIKYPYGASVEDALAKLEYDLYYIKNMSPFLDTKIFLKTIGVMIFRQGAR